MKRHGSCVNPNIIRLLSTLDPGGEVENDALLKQERIHSERKNGLCHQDQIWP